MSKIATWLNPYLRYLEWIVLGLVFFAGYKTCDVLHDAARARQLEGVVNSVPQIIEKTRTITKVIHDSNDPCSGTAIPEPILNELRKQ